MLNAIDKLLASPFAVLVLSSHIEKFLLALDQWDGKFLIGMISVISWWIFAEATYHKAFIIRVDVRAETFLLANRKRAIFEILVKMKQFFLFLSILSMTCADGNSSISSWWWSTIKSMGLFCVNWCDVTPYGDNRGPIGIVWLSLKRIERLIIWQLREMHLSSVFTKTLISRFAVLINVRHVKINRGLALRKVFREIIMLGNQSEIHFTSNHSRVLCACVLNWCRVYCVFVCLFVTPQVVGSSHWNRQCLMIKYELDYNNFYFILTNLQSKKNVVINGGEWCVWKRCGRVFCIISAEKQNVNGWNEINWRIIWERQAYLK